MVSANRAAAISPLSTIRTRYGKSVSNPEATVSRTCKTQQNSLKKEKPIRNFSIDPTSSIRTRLRTPFLQAVPESLLKGARVSDFGVPLRGGKALWGPAEALTVGCRQVLPRCGGGPLSQRRLRPSRQFPRALKCF